MSIKYSEIETKEFYKTQLSELNGKMDQLYNLDCINWGGSTKGDESKPYSEILVKEIDVDKLDKIEQIDRKSPYYCNHQDVKKGYDGQFDKLSEKDLAKCLYNKKIKELGYIFDYQVPLKDIQEDKAGEIDLVSITDNSDIYLIELKRIADPSKSTKQDTLLRCGLEIYTYFKQINKDKFGEEVTSLYLEHFKSENQEISKLLKKFDGKSREFKKAVLIFEGSKAANMALSNEYTETKNLLRKLGVEIFIYKKEIKYSENGELEDLILIKHIDCK